MIKISQESAGDGVVLSLALGGPWPSQPPRPGSLRPHGPGEHAGPRALALSGPPRVFRARGSGSAGPGLLSARSPHPNNYHQIPKLKKKSLKSAAVPEQPSIPFFTFHFKPNRLIM